MAISTELIQRTLAAIQAEQRSAKERDEVLHKDFGLLRDRLAENEVALDTGFRNLADKLEALTELLGKHQ